MWNVDKSLPQNIVKALILDVFIECRGPFTNMD